MNEMPNKEKSFYFLKKQKINIQLIPKQRNKFKY